MKVELNKDELLQAIANGFGAKHEVPVGTVMHVKVITGNKGELVATIEWGESSNKRRGSVTHSSGITQHVIGAAEGEC